jgi:recombinational DNA repair protein RecT
LPYLCIVKETHTLKKLFEIMEKVVKNGLVITSVQEAQVQLQNGLKNGDKDLLKQALLHLNPEALKNAKLVTKYQMHAAAFMSLIQKNSSLAACSVQSLAGAFLRTFEAGLSVSPEARECYVIPRQGQAEIQIGYVAYTTRIAAKGNFVVTSEVVLEGEYFKAFTTGGNGIKFEHTINPNRNKYTQKIVGAYARLLNQKTGAFLDFAYLSEAELNNLRLRNTYQKNASKTQSAGAKKGAWETDEAAMSQAKAIKQLVLRSTGCLELTALDEQVFVQDLSGELETVAYQADAETIDAEIDTSGQILNECLALLDKWEQEQDPAQKDAIRGRCFDFIVSNKTHINAETGSELNRIYTKMPRQITA